MQDLLLSQLHYKRERDKRDLKRWEDDLPKDYRGLALDRDK